MPSWTVRAHGTDSSGRTIWASDYMWDVWERVVDDLGFRPTIVQGAWMVKNGGGAAASAGYHDGGGCFDLRVWDMPLGAPERVVRTLRRFGAAAWVRDKARGGMDPHIHFVLGSDHDIASGARFQWQQYLNGRDGLASNGPDYHWRPNPLVTRPPAEDYMSSEDAKTRLKAIAANQERIERKLDNLLEFIDERVRATSYKRDERLKESIKRLEDDK